MKRRTFLQIIGGIFGSVVAGGVVAASSYPPMKMKPPKKKTKACENCRTLAFNFHDELTGKNVWYKTRVPVTPGGIKMMPSYITYRANIIVDVDTGELLKNRWPHNPINDYTFGRYLKDLPTIDNPGKISKLMGYKGPSFY